MGLLNQDYYNNVINDSNQPEVPIVQPTQPITPAQTPTPTPNDKFPDITPQQQTERFGGTVGSQEYYQNKTNQSLIRRLPSEIGGALGIELPPEEQWDKMSRNEQAMTVTGASLKAVAHLAFSLPKVIANIPIGIGETGYQGWNKITKGTPLVEKEPFVNKITGEVPSYFKTYQDARDKGMGPLSSSLLVFGRASGDFLIGRDAGIALKNSFAPRSIPLKEGEVIRDTSPIDKILTKEQEKIKAKQGVDHPSEYYPLTKTDAKKFGGPFANSGNTFFKFTPAVADGSKIELSIVKVDSALKETFNKIGEKIGIKDKSTNGKFGSENKVYSQIIDVGKKDEVAIEFSNPTIPSKPLKGFEDKLVTTEQISNIDAISKYNKIDPGIESGVIKALTGKDVIGDLSQAEYVNIARTLSKLKKAEQFAPETLGFGNWTKNYLSPTRYWTRDVQQATGLPVHDIHMQIETGTRLAKVSEKTQLGNLYSNSVIEKYAGSKYAGERALVKEYIEGNKSAILDNPSLSTQVKNDLIESAGIFDSFLKTIAEDIGMESKTFIENYAPHIQERGGVFQLYKETGNIPSGSEAFFQQKRTGGLYSQIGDMWALADIYTRSAYKAKYLAPALDSANAIKNSLPLGVRERFSSYVQEKLGYGGELEKVLDSTALTLNKKLGLNLPADTARQMTNQALNTMYSSAMSQPATWLRNSFQYPTLGYAYWGSEFMGEAMSKAYSKAGMNEFLKSGFSVDLGVPFGEEISKATITSKVGGYYRDFTQGILKPQGWVENRNRAPMYFQTKMIFEDTINKVNSGKLTWVQAEKKLGLDTLNQLDANLIRQDLVKGNLTSARDKLIQEAIDDTQFPYRRGESWRLGYGMSGKLSTPFMQWPNEYIHTIGKWAGTGQWDKIARWYASSSLIVRTFSQNYNTDFSKSLTFGPLKSLNYSPPPAEVILNGVGLIYNHIAGNEQAYEKNGEALLKTLKLAIPGGVEGSNLKKAYEAYKNGPVGPNGTYAYPDASGRPNYYSFKDLFWNSLGMPTIQKTENQNLQREMTTDKFKYSQAKKEVLNLYQDGMSSISAGESSGQKYIDQANKMIEEYAQKGIDLSPSDDDFNKFYIPATEQTWNSLPAALKAKFAPRVFSLPK